MKKDLTIRSRTLLKVSCIKLNQSVNGAISRVDFQSSIRSLIGKIHKPIEKALIGAGVQIDDLFAIESYGGNSRIPAIKAELSRIFGQQ